MKACEKALGEVRAFSSHWTEDQIVKHRKCGAIVQDGTLSAPQL